MTRLRTHPGRLLRAELDARGLSAKGCLWNSLVKSYFRAAAWTREHNPRSVHPSADHRYPRAAHRQPLQNPAIESLVAVTSLQAHNLLEGSG